MAAVIRTSLELLDDDESSRFGELGIFPEDADIPVGIVARLWAATGGLDDIATEDLLAKLYDLSLLLSLDFSVNTIRFHDTTRKFLQDHVGKDGLIEQHKRLILAIGDIRADKATPSTEVEYFYRYLPEHLAAAGHLDSLRELLLDPSWLKAKLVITKSPQSLVADFQLIQHRTPEIDFVEKTLVLTMNILASDPSQLLPQFLGRVVPDEAMPALSKLLDRARAEIVAPCLLPARATFTFPGGSEMRRFLLNGQIRALEQLPSGRFIAGIADGRIIELDIATGQTRTLVASRGMVRSLAVLPDGRVVSGSSDARLGIWNIADGTCTELRKGMRRPIYAIAYHSSGRLLTGGASALLVWNLDAGTNVELSGHASEIRTITLLPDGRVVTGSEDHDLRVWTLETGESHRLCGHSGPISAVATLGNGRIISSSQDRSVRIWDLADWSNCVVDSDATWLRSFAHLPDGRLVAGFDYGGIRILNLDGKFEFVAMRHPSAVLAMKPASAHTIVTGCADGAVRVVDLAVVRRSGSKNRHRRRVSTLLQAPKHGIVSGSSDRTLRIWHFSDEDGALLGRQQKGVHRTRIRIARPNIVRQHRRHDPRLGPGRRAEHLVRGAP